MIIDLNASLGHYPFRSLVATRPDQIVALLDRNGIATALVGSLHAAFYRDAQRGNEELVAGVAALPRRLVPVGTVNPAYAGWQRDLAQCVERWKMKAVALLPEQHGYALSDERGQAALARIAEYGVPVVLRQRFEDRRQRHAWDRAEDGEARAVMAAGRAHPTLKLVLVNWLGLDGAALVAAGLQGRCLVDIARPQVVLRKDVLRLMETLGPDAVGFGSHLPFEYVAPSLIKLESIRHFRPQDHDAVAWRNAARFLQLEM